MIGRGKYEVQPGFQRKVCKQEEEWLMRMKESDRARHMKMVASLKVFQADEEEALISVNQAGTSGLCGGVLASGCCSRRSLSMSSEVFSLSIQMNSLADQVAVPLSVLEGIWEKAEQLLGTKNTIKSSYGQKLFWHSFPPCESQKQRTVCV